MRELERSLGPVSVLAISMSAMLGSGIFVLPGLAAAQTGPSVWLAYVLAGLCAFPAAACKAELATAMPTSGGTYVYLDRIFGPFFGTVAGMALWLSMLLKSAFALIGFGTYLIVLTDLPLLPTASLLLILIVALNVLGVQKVGRAQVVILALTTAALLGLVALSFPKLDRSNLNHELTHGVSGLIAATGFVFVSYNGVTKVAAIAEEVKNPGRNLPLGMIGSLLLAMLLYALISLALVGTVPHAELAVDLHPIYTLAERAGGRWAGLSAAVVGVVTLTSMANAGLLAASRFPFAMARDRLLPGALKEISRRFGTPTWSIFATGGAMLIAIWLLDVERLAKIASGLVIMLYMANNFAVVVFREGAVHWYQPKYRSPLYPYLQGFGILSGAGLLILLGPSALVGAGLAALPGLAVYLLYGRRRVERVGVLGQRSRRAQLLQEPPSQRPNVSVEGNASVVVALFGKEHSPEVIVELGAALARDKKLAVIHLKEVPEHTIIEALVEEDVTVQSLRRRVNALAEERGVEIEFHAVLSRDLGNAVHSVSAQANCEWLVMEWRGRERHTLMPYNPIGWLINNLDADLALFKDAGVRHVREILVYAEPGPHDALVVSTADHLARLWNAHLTLVRFVHESEDSTSATGEQDYLQQLKELCATDAKVRVVRGDNRIRTLAGETAAYDLLVMGAPDVTLLRQLRGTDQDRIKARSVCSVLTVRTPRRSTHRAYEQVKTSQPGSPRSLPDFLAPGALGARVPVMSKDALFQHFAQSFSPAIGVSSKRIVEALWERERTQNTSVGHAVALPHATLPEANGASVGVFVTDGPIDYQGPDDQPVDIFFVTICPPSERQTHLELLSRIAALTLKTDLLDRLRSAQDEESMRAALVECSAEIAG